MEPIKILQMELINGICRIHEEADLFSLHSLVILGELWDSSKKNVYCFIQDNYAGDGDHYAGFDLRLIEGLQSAMHSQFGKKFLGREVVRVEDYMEGEKNDGINTHLINKIKGDFSQFNIHLFFFDYFSDV